MFDQLETYYEKSETEIIKAVGLKKAQDQFRALKQHNAKEKIWMHIDEGD